MNREERKYFVQKLQSLVVEWFYRHTHVGESVGDISLDTFIERRMATISGQQMLPQGTFRDFLDELRPHFVNLQADIDKISYDRNQDHQLLALLLKYFGGMVLSKPVINCVAISSEADIVEPIEGRFYLIPPSGSFGGKLFVGTSNNSYSWETPDTNYLYLTTSNAGTHYYAYDSTKFVEVSYDGTTLQVDKLATLVNMTLNAGVYNVEHVIITSGSVHITALPSSDSDIEDVVAWLDAHTNRGGADWENMVDFLLAGGATITIDGESHTIVKSIEMPNTAIFARYPAGDVANAAAPYAWKYESYVFYTESETPADGDNLFYASDEEVVPGQEAEGAIAGQIEVSESFTYAGNRVNQGAIDDLYDANATISVDMVSYYVIGVYTMLVSVGRRLLHGTDGYAESGINDWVWHRYIFQGELDTTGVNMPNSQQTLSQYLAELDAEVDSLPHETISTSDIDNLF